MSDDNGRNITARELRDKLDLIRSDQRSEHWRTRVWLIGLVAAHIGLTTVGATSLIARGLTWPF